MRLIDADQLCEDLLNRWSIADTRKEELIRQVMADIVTPIVVSQPTVNQWIPCSERLPEDGVEILVCDIDGDIDLAHLCKWQGNRFFDSWGDKIKNVKAWMPLPDPYKEDKT